MGNCVGAKSQSRYDTRDKYNAQPTDTSTLDPLTYPLLNLKTLLTKLKLKRCSYYKFVGMRIEFGKYHQFDLKPKFIVNETAHWDVYHSFSFMATQYDLRKQFMQFTFVDDKNQVLGNLKINLYLLATGPYHQDFALDLQKGEGRISFNLKLCQEVELKLLVKEAQMIPSDKQFPGDIFAFNMKGLFGNRVQESQASYKFLVSLNQKELGEQQQKVSSKRIQRKQTLIDRPTKSETPRLKKMASNNQSQHDPTLIKQGLSKKINWSQTVSKDMPFIETSIPLFDVHGGSFIINFYSYSNKTMNLSSECFISYNKLYNQEFILKRDQQKRKNYEIRNIEVVSKSWDHGKETGTAKFLLEFTIEQHLKQMQLCVRTEKGILESSPVVGETGSSGKMPQELLQLQKLANEIQNQFIQISGSKADVKNYKWTAEINKRLLKQREILLISSKQSKLIFAYSDQNGVLKGQRALIQLGKKVKALLDEDNEQIGPNCWNLLISLIKRGEFNLAHMGFTHQQIQSYQSGNATQFTKRKKDVGLSYYQLLVQLLQRTFQSLQAYNYESQRQFAELFCAYAYFRLPKFRNQVLTVITRASDPEIQEWRGTQYSLNEQSSESKQEQGAYTLMFDWQNKFYKLLQNQQSFIKCDQKLKQLLRTSSWEERMKKRGGAFFAFVKYWANYVQSIAINSKHISWRYFPGYTKILLSFMAEMKIRPISNYTEVMKKAAASMLTNDKLLNPFVLILFRKTNENDQPTVIKTFDLISMFFTSIKNRGRNLPSTFDLKLLMRAIKSILQGEASYAIGKVLLLIYDHFKLFPLDFRLELTNYLMTKVFFKLFLHWSHNVRTIFHHLLFIRVYHQASKPVDQHDQWDQEVILDNPQYRTETISRYRKLMLILQNTEHFQHKIRTNKIDLYEKDTYKKLRKKVQEKRKGATNPDNSIKKKFSDQNEYRKQLMLELGQPKLQSYASEVFAKNLVVVMEKKMLTPAKEEVIVRNSNSRTSDVSSQKTVNKRKRSIAITNFQDELVALKDEEIPYTRRALQQYGQINELFINHIQKNKDTVPVVRLELSLDEKELRPDGLTEHQQW